MPQPVLSVCVYCGARDGTDPAFARAAEEVGAMLARRGWRLIYGAGDVGLMGRVAAAAREQGGATLGVIPTHLLGRERQGEGPGTLVVTETMHERKKVMFMNADAIAVLPGGAGTLDEMFEVLTWRQLGLHAKPIALLNVAGYWDPLLALVARVVEAGFSEPSLRTLLHPVNDVAALGALLASRR